MSFPGWGHKPAFVPKKTPRAEEHESASSRPAALQERVGKGAPPGLSSQCRPVAWLSPAATSPFAAVLPQSSGLGRCSSGELSAPSRAEQENLGAGLVENTLSSSGAFLSSPVCAAAGFCLHWLLYLYLCIISFHEHVSVLEWEIALNLHETPDVRGLNVNKCVLGNSRIWVGAAGSRD